MKIISNKLKLILVLAFISFASFVFALIPTFMVSAAYIPKTNGFGISYIGINLDQNNPSDLGNTKFTITFTTELTEDCFDIFTQNGTKEIAVGVLVGPNKFVNSGDVTDYQSAIDNNFHAIMNCGTQNSGANNLIEFDYNRPFSFEGGVIFNEKSISNYASKVNGKSGDDLLFEAASLDLAIIPFYSVCEGGNRTPVVNMGDAMSFIAKPYLYEAYVASTNNNPNAPVVNDYMLKKFVTKNNSVNFNLQSEGEYYIDKGYDCLFSAKHVGEDLTYYDAVGVAGGMAKREGDRLYIGGYEFFGESTGLNENRLVDPIPFIDNLIDRENYTYSITLFRTNGDIISANAKCVTAIFTSSSSYTETNISYTTSLTHYYKTPNGGLQWFTSKFVNPADENGNPTITYDGYYVLGRNIKLTNFIQSYGKTPTKTDGVHGFTGVFDGRGKVIYDGYRRYQNVETGAFTGSEAGMQTNGAGIFSVIDGGTVKNLAIYNTTIGKMSKEQTIFASLINNATIENVYIRPLSFFDNIEGAFTQDVGYLFAKEITNSHLKNVVIENNIFNIKVKDSDPEYTTRNSSAVATFKSIENSTLENVFVAGCSPLSATIINDSSTQGFGVEVGVTELPKLADGSTAKANKVYYFSDPKNATLVDEFKPLVEFVGLNCQRIPSLNQNTLFVKFKLMPSQIKTFTTTRALAMAISGNSNIKKAFLDTPYWRIDSNELIWNVVSNYQNGLPQYGNVVEDITCPADLTFIKEEEGHTLTGIVPFM